ncbi:MAG: VOC family protein [Proteobacteria bacterium]|nr:VOC family protein [Pseudomonadota bacterium]
MADRRPLWPARLHHLGLVSADAGALVGFYQRVLGYDAEELTEGRWRLRGRERELLVSQGARAGLGFAAFAVEDGARLAALRADIEAKGAGIEASPSPLLGDDAFAIKDPDGNALVFGPPREARDGAADALCGRLQHFVVTSPAIKPMMAFYEDVLGFVLSDVVDGEARDGDGGGDPAAVFYRSDPEHHSFAIFRADHGGLDHHAYESGCWNDIRDWADHLSALRVPMFWGPGRHGPGNNLFVMFRDADGNALEISAELEEMPIDMAHRQWPHDARTLNLWGDAWFRSEP